LAWSDHEKLEKKYKGLKKTFEKLKQRERLCHEDISPLQQFIDATIICSTNKNKIKQMLSPDGGATEEDPDCNQECEPFSCSLCCEKWAQLIKERVEEVNTHYHTKTCRKHGPDCRFGIPRPPSEYTVIAQTMTEEERKSEAETVIGLAFIMGKVKAKLKRVEEDLRERRKTNRKAEIEGTLQEMLQELFPDVRLAANEEFIIIQEDEDVQVRVKTALVKEAWMQNPKSKEQPINLETFKERLQSAVYHFALTIITYGTKVILQRELKDIFVNNYNPGWMVVWNGNLDIQAITDYFSCIVYMADYVCKPEKNIMNILKDVNKAKKKERASQRDTMWALAHAYMTSREMGECEAYYKLDSSLHYKQSNIKCIFITSGFPQNRSRFLKKCRWALSNNY
jgi:hypothetical protein